MVPNSLLNSLHDSDVALIGTGLAPLIAASHLLSQGKTVLLLNPDFDFFLEDSELPLDPMLPLKADALKPEALAAQNAESVLAELRPYFPGAVEGWIPGSTLSEGYHDVLAPHVRQRNRLWIQPDHGAGEAGESWGLLEEAYVHASDAGMNPKILDGLHAAKKFPGFASTVAPYRGLLLSKFCDVDVPRYRNGILEFVRERLGAARFVLSAAQIETMPGGLRFYSGGKPCTARVQERILVFWTPRLSSWILAQAKRAEKQPRLPRGVRLWEQWSLVSREDLDAEVMGTYGDMVVWSEVEGTPDAPLLAGALNRLSVLRYGPLAALDDLDFSWISAQSLSALSGLCYDFLKWNRFSVRSMKPRAILEWENPTPWNLSDEPLLRVVPACDGPLVQVVRRAREATG